MATIDPNISANNITPVDPLKASDNIMLDDYNAIVAGLNKETESMWGTYTSSQNDLMSKQKELGTQSAYESELERSYGVSDNEKQLRDLQAQLMSVNAEAEIAQLNMDKQGDPTRLTAASELDKSVIERERAVKALRLSASMQAIQGSLTLANSKIERAIALKYDPIKAEIDALNTQIDYNYKSFSKLEQRRADAVKEANNFKLQQLEIQRANEKAWEVEKNEALSNGAPLSVIQKAEQLKASGNENAARAAVAPYTGVEDYGKTDPDDGKFTDTQLNKGASVAGMTISAFKALDADTQNFFINSATSAKGLIDDNVESGASREDILNDINGQKVNQSIKDYLIKYLDSQLPAPKEEPKKEEKAKGKKKWWQNLLWTWGV